MVGFIGALSSSLCILILVFITLVVGYIDSLIPSSVMQKIDENTYRYPVKTYYVSTDIIDEVDQKIIELKEKEKFETGYLQVGCEGGFDIDLKSADNIMVFNTIKMNSHQYNIPVIMYDGPTVSEHSLNYCYIDFKRE